MPPSPSIVWFKRDLRVEDHAPLAQAAARGPVIPLYIVEPELWRQPDSSLRQWQFIKQSLNELALDVEKLGGRLLIMTGPAVQVLDRLRDALGVDMVWSHEETGNGWTYRRDRAVQHWARLHGVTWNQLPQFGVVRRLASRDGWARRWDRFMDQPIIAPPARVLTPELIHSTPLPDQPAPHMAPAPLTGGQTGGRAAGLERLASFLEVRGEGYQKAMSSPLTAADGCSRLSPHLAFGTVSLREVTQAVRRARREAWRYTGASTWGKALHAFQGRLHWHCHFIQKLESDPSFEHEAAHPAYRGIRQPDAHPERLAAWTDGRTGWPFVDACMRALAATGWMTFRMRAMLQAVASYHLRLDWRESGLVLARCFVDYEPGIHWNQVQMQSGTTGINTIRIYNPVKQGQDQDPNGRFIRCWVPELQGVPAPFIHQPWTMSGLEQEAAGCRIGRDYPSPLRDHLDAAREARERIHAVRKQPDFAPVADRIQARHGSRRSGLAATGRQRSQRGDSRQRRLDI